MALGGVSPALCKLMACPLLPPMAAPLSLKAATEFAQFQQEHLLLSRGCSLHICSGCDRARALLHLLSLLWPFLWLSFMLCLLNDCSNSSLCLLIVSLGPRENSTGEEACCFLIRIKVCQIWQASWDTLKRPFHYIVSVTCPTVTSFPAKKSIPSLLEWMHYVPFSGWPFFSQDLERYPGVFLLFKHLISIDFRSISLPS